MLARFRLLYPSLSFSFPYNFVILPCIPPCIDKDTVSQSTVAESHKVELTFGVGREGSHGSVVYGFGFPGSDYP